MAKRKAARTIRRAKPAKKKAARKMVAKRSARPAARNLKKTAKKPAAKKASKKPAKPAAVVAKQPQLDRVRRTLDDTIVPTPPSSLNMERHGSAARSGRAEMTDNQRKRGRSMSPEVTGGDVDADFEDAYFSGDEAPGGDNPTPDQEVVDDIGRALGVEYNDNEELKSADKLSKRDKHRWELDPASSEDYKERD